MHLGNVLVVYGNHGLFLQSSQFSIHLVQEFLTNLGLKTPVLTFSGRSFSSVLINICKTRVTATLNCRRVVLTQFRRGFKHKYLIQAGLNTKKAFRSDAKLSLRKKANP